MSVVGILLLLAIVAALFFWIINRRQKASLFQQPFFSLHSLHFPQEPQEDEEEQIWQQWQLSEELNQLREPEWKSEEQQYVSPPSAANGKRVPAKRRILLYLGLFLTAIALSVGSYYLGRYHQRLATSTPEVSPKISFGDAVNYATSAAEKAQTAETPQQWRQVANLWENAIAGMKSVPASSDKYNMAQEKVKEYQKYLKYARQNAEKASDSQ